MLHTEFQASKPSGSTEEDFVTSFMYTAAPLYRRPIDRGNRYNVVVLCRPLLIKKKFQTNN